MLSNFKKLGVAAAVATALGASGAAQAVILGQPGDALLVPYVWSTGPGNVNTMISIISASAATVNTASFGAVSDRDVKVDADGNPIICEPKDETFKLHWFFYNYESKEKANGFIDITCEDWVGIDWASAIYGEGGNWRPLAQEQRGYLVITDDAADDAGNASRVILYGSAFQIRGNWATQAFIPVLPLLDDGTAADEVNRVLGQVQVNPVTAGMALSDTEGTPVRFSLRYYLQTSPPEGSTEFVLWFPDNSFDADVSNRPDDQQVVDVYGPDETFNSTVTSIPYELNVLLVSPDASEDDVDPGKGYTSFISGSLDPVTGFVTFSVDDYGDEDTLVAPRAGIAFSLIGVNGANAVQVQTELAHERGLAPAND